jgi:Tol biopolymer transport system component
VKNLGKNIVILLALLGAGFFLAYIRFRPHLEEATSWTDGETVYQDTKPEGIRYALWEAPVSMGGNINSDEDELRPAVSPDGRFIVFASGEPGLNQDLYISEIINGEADMPRPLWEVNTDYDEMAPAFAPDGLYFASNRPGGQGGMDLYKVPYYDGDFDDAEPIRGEGVNTAANEVDPAPVPGQLAIAFASDRKRGQRTDYDLYMAKPAGASGLVAEPIARLNTPFHEREPAFVGDARTLLFASDRIEGGFGGYDIWRSVNDAGIWLDPDNQEGLNTDADQRGPAPTPDGFTVLYTVEKEGLSSDVYRAQSRELFRMPGKPVGWLDFLILGGLLLLALLAWLAKKWKTVDLLYKCFLIALLVHALMLWWFREVHPENAPVDTPARESMFKVRLAVSPARTNAANQEFGGSLNAERSEMAEIANPERAEVEPTEVAEAIDSAPTRQLARTETELASSPQRTELQVERTESAEPTKVAQTDIAAPSEQVEKRTTEAATLEVASAASEIAAERTEQQTANAPARTEVNQDITEVAAAPAERTQTRVERQLENAPTFAESASELIEVAQAQRDPNPTSAEMEVAAPSEQVVKITGDNPSFEVAQAPTNTEFTPTERTAEGPQRQEVTSEEALAIGETNPEPTFDPGSGLERGDGGFSSGQALAVAEPTREVTEFRPESVSQASMSEVDVAAPQAELNPETGLAVGTRATEEGPTAEETLIADISTEATASRTERATEGPTRADTVSETSTEFDPLSDLGSALEVAQMDVERPTEFSNPSGPTRKMTDFLPDAAPSASLPEVALSDQMELPQSEVEGNPAEETEAFESGLLAGVTSVDAPDRTAFGDLSGPTRDQIEMASDDLSDPVGPAFEQLTAMEEIRAPEPVTPVEAERLEHTPYKNRFGDQKEIALKEHGGSVETEAAVAAGLAYLAGVQNEGGFWGSRSDRQQKYRQVVVGKTALSLLAFLGANHTPQSNSQYSDVSARAIDYLLEIQDSRTGHFGDSSSYGHGISTYALSEAYALTQDERLRAPLEKAVKWILQKQVKSMDPKLDGGWGYYFQDADGYENDRWPRISVSSWQIMALESARLGGLDVPDEAFARARRYVRGSVDPRHGWVRYSHNPSRLSSAYPTLPASTPAGLFAAALVGEDITSDFYEDAVNFTVERAPTGYAYKGDDAFVQRAEGNLYFWYYATLAMFRMGGEPWEKWNESMKSTLLEAQDEDGSWKPISIYARYAGDDWRDKSYTTAINVLTLEVYYRYFTPLLTVGPIDD